MDNQKSNYSKRIVLFVMIVIMIASKAWGQSYSSLNSGFELQGNVNALYFDTTTNILYAGGLINQTYYGVITNGLSQWNGTIWDSMGVGITSVGWVSSITKYNGDILIGGTFDASGSVYSPGILKWNGTSYSPFATALGFGGGGCVYDLKTIDSTLYVSGCFNWLNGIPAYGLAKFDGANWTIFPTLSNNQYHRVGNVIKYNSDLYAGGSFNLTTSSPPIYAMAKWNGSQWQNVGTGFGDINDEVTSMVEYNNELYVVGFFSTAFGSPGNNIAKWNGSTWSQCGTGLTGNIATAVEYNGFLYVGGVIGSAGGVSVNSIAKWDGSQWYVVPGGNFSNITTIVTMCTDNNDLYIGGHFDYVGNMLANNVVKYNMPVGVKNEYHTNLPVTVYPTLAHNTIKFSYNTIVQSTGDVKIYNSTGQTVYSACNINLNHAEFDVSRLPAGVYHLRVYAKDGEGGAKFVKE